MRRADYTLAPARPDQFPEHEITLVDAATAPIGDKPAIPTWTFDRQVSTMRVKLGWQAMLLPVPERSQFRGQGTGAGRDGGENCKNEPNFAQVDWFERAGVGADGLLAIDTEPGELGLQTQAHDFS